AVRSLTNPHEPIDAIFLDYRLPDSDDLNLLATIRRLAPRSPVILMTAYGSPEVTRGAFELGVYQVMNKPFELQNLQPLLLEACNRLKQDDRSAGLDLIGPPVKQD
ncbi:MAG: response regulator, partial [Acidobacteria bacterium]